MLLYNKAIFSSRKENVMKLTETKIEINSGKI